LQILPVLLRHDLTTGKRVIISERRGMNSGASWSPDGTKIALTLSFSGKPEIYIMPSGGGNPTPISRDVKIKTVTGGYQPNYSNLLFDVEPDFHTDGKRLVFSSARTGHPMIYWVDLQTMEGRQLTFAGTYNSSPKWAPRSERIAFAAQRIGSGNFDLYYIDSDGTNLSRLTKGGLDGKMRVNSENPTWAPTGRHLAYSSNRTGQYAIYVSTLDGNFVKQISPPDKECTLPSWGPADK
jgi:TolB protein